MEANKLCPQSTSRSTLATARQAAGSSSDRQTNAGQTQLKDKPRGLTERQSGAHVQNVNIQPVTATFTGAYESPCNSGGEKQRKTVRPNIEDYEIELFLYIPSEFSFNQGPNLVLI